MGDRNRTMCRVLGMRMLGGRGSRLLLQRRSRDLCSRTGCRGLRYWSGRGGERWSFYQWSRVGIGRCGMG